MSDLEDCWADIRPPPLPKIEPEPLPPPRKGFGYVWLGLLSEGRELDVRGYHRQRVEVPADNVLTFRASFPMSSYATVSGVAVFLREQAGKDDTMLWRSDFTAGPRNLISGDTMNATLIVNDGANEFCGLRKILELLGVGTDPEMAEEHAAP